MDDSGRFEMGIKGGIVMVVLTNYLLVGKLHTSGEKK